MHGQTNVKNAIHVVRTICQFTIRKQYELPWLFCYMKQGSTILGQNAKLESDKLIRRVTTSFLLGFFLTL